MCESHGGGAPQVQRGELRRGVSAALYGRLGRDVANLVALDREAGERVLELLASASSMGDLLTLGVEVEKELARVTAARVERALGGGEVHPPLTREERDALALLRAVHAASSA